MEISAAAEWMLDGYTIHSSMVGWAYRLNGIGSTEGRPDGGEWRMIGVGINALTAHDWRVTEDTPRVWSTAIIRKSK